jgi:hypothetical protein
VSFFLHSFHRTSCHLVAEAGATSFLGWEGIPPPPEVFTKRALDESACSWAEEEGSYHFRLHQNQMELGTTHLVDHSGILVLFLADDMSCRKLGAWGLRR